MDKMNRFLNWESDPIVLENFFNWIQFNSNLKTLKLDINCDVDQLKTEILPKVAVTTPHRDEDGRGWRSASLHGYSSIMTDSDDYYKNLGFDLTEEKHWTSLSTFFPKTKKWILENIPFNKFGRVRLMIIEPGGYVYPHKDYPRGQCLAGINVAINHPLGVKYIIAGEEIIWQEGESRLIDIGSIHEIKNDSDEYRVHIIVHGEPINQWGEAMMKLVCRSYLIEENQ